jgi:hypothetical protein
MGFRTRGPSDPVCSEQRACAVVSMRFIIINGR